ncbi:hypothetical protein SH501x_000405 [Pirellulaceae bacterium SH501]
MFWRSKPIWKPLVAAGVLAVGLTKQLPLARSEEPADQRFRERFAIADDRSKLLSELIPGTENYYFYQCLHLQTLGRIDESRVYLNEWGDKIGSTPLRSKLEFRQYLLEYSRNPEATRKYLEQNHGLQLSHPAPQKDEAAKLPTALNESELQLAERLKQFFRESRFTHIEDPAPLLSLGVLQSREDKVDWIGALQRTDIPGLVEVIAEELQHPQSNGFGWASIHRMLSAEQLDALSKKIPALNESSAFIVARLRCVRPIDYESLDNPKVRSKHLQDLWSLVSKLPASQNSLKANVLYQQLLLDEQSEEFALERFLMYLAIPNTRPICRVELREQNQNAFPVRFDMDFRESCLIPPIGEDVSLIERYLQHFFRKGEPIERFSEWLDRDYLQAIYARTSILFGIGDSKVHYAKFTPSQQRELQNRIELYFASSNTNVYRGPDQVRLSVWFKNTPKVTVKIYKLNAREILLRTPEGIHAGIELDGLSPNAEKSLSYTEPSDRLHREEIVLPELEGEGLWAVDVLASGRRCRALIQKGGLVGLHSSSDLGHIVKVFDLDGKHAPTATAWFGEREFLPGQDGSIVIPFSNEEKVAQIVLSRGDYASRESFRHAAESYTIRCALLGDPQQLLTGAKPRLAIRPTLYCNGQLSTVSQLEQVRLVIRSTDQDGIESVQDFVVPRLANDEEWIPNLMIPPRLSKVELELKGRIKRLSNDTYQDVSDRMEVSVNQTSELAQIADAFVRKTPNGFLLEIKGRNGEPIGRQPVDLLCKQTGISQPARFRVATDENGAVRLGMLPNVLSIQVVMPGMETRTIPLGPITPDWPSKLHLSSQESFELPMVSELPEVPSEAPNLPRFELREIRQGQSIRHVAGVLSIENNKLTGKSMQPGRYLLTDHLGKQSVEITVSRAAVEDGVVASSEWIAESTVSRLTCIQPPSLDQERVRIQVDNATPAARVHILASTYLPSSSPLASLRRTGSSPRSQVVPYAMSLFLSSLKLDEEYQYVLDRRNSKLYPGTLLPPPSMLLQPWELTKTVNETQVAEAGEDLPSLAPASPTMAAEDARKQASGATPGSRSADYEFLKHASYLACNLKLDADGKLDLPLDAMKDYCQLTIVVVDEWNTASSTVALPNSKVATIDRRLASTLATQQRYAEKKLTQLVAPKEPIKIADAQGTRIKLVASLQDVASIYRGLLSSDAALNRWGPFLGWHKLSLEAKKKHYTELASHEANLFLFRHDRPFFDEVVRPFIRNKPVHQFVDDYLLEKDLQKYLEPWRLAQLNAAEKVLLAQRMPEAKPRLLRWMREWVESHPLPSDQLERIFMTAMRSEKAEGFERNMLNVDADFSDPSKRWSNSPSGGFGGRMELHHDMDEKIALKSEAASDKELKLQRSRSARRELAEVELLKDRLVRGYEAMETTRKWAETQYWQIPLQEQKTSLIPPNQFWIELLEKSANGSVGLPLYFEQATETQTSALMALAMLDLPFEQNDATVQVVDNDWRIESPTPAILFAKGIKSIESEKEAGSVLLSQQIYSVSQTADPNKPWGDKPLVKGWVYRLRSVVSNPNPTPWKGQVLQQLPSGAIPLAKAKFLAANEVEVAPFGIQEVNSLFYMPAAGDFNMLGAQISQNGKSVGAAKEINIRVEAVPSDIDRSEWSYVAAWASGEQVLAYLKDCNLQKTDLQLMLWRLSDKEFYSKCVQVLRELGAFDTKVWAYAWKHDDRDRIREHLSSSTEWVSYGLPYFHSDLVDLDAESRLAFEHFDFRPLVLARFHSLGSKTQILNDAFRAQYDHVLEKMSYQPKLEAMDRLSMVYYLLLQNRIDDAMAMFQKVDRNELMQKDQRAEMQFDYMEAYLAVLKRDYATANNIASKYIDYPHGRWNSLFKQLRRQLAQRDAMLTGSELAEDTEANSSDTISDRILFGDRESAISAQSQTDPSLELVDDAGSVVAQFRNIESFEVRFYPMDIELQFSRYPFQSGQSKLWSRIDANRKETISVEATSKWSKRSITIPNEYRNSNLMVEVVSNGIARNLVLYSHSLRVQFASNAGRVQVLEKNANRPVDGAYVKVYARGADGAVRFYKDGYTDLRGQFDYTTISVGELADVERFAVLVLHPDLGAVVQEVAPPKR